jgi:uncharacterized protein (DUF697 family)
MGPSEELTMDDKQQQAAKIVKTHMWLSMAAGFIPVPVVDLVAVSGVQLKMLAEISKTYDVPFQENRGKAAMTSLVGFILPSTMAYGAFGSLLKAVPIVGVLAGAPAMALFCGAYSWALGNVFIQHFASGGTFLTFDPEKVKEHFKAQFEEGRKVAVSLGAEKKAAAPGAVAV